MYSSLYRYPMSIFLTILIGTALFIACQNKHALENNDHTPDPIIEDNIPPVTDGFFCRTEPYFETPRPQRWLWAKDDRIAVFKEVNIAKTYTLMEEYYGNPNGMFTVENRNDANTELSSGIEIPAIVAIYPYIDGLKCSTASIDDRGRVWYTVSGFNFPSLQVYSANPRPHESLVMVAINSMEHSYHELQFLNACGALEIQLCGSCKIKSIKLEGNNGEVLAGTGSITASANLEPDPDHLGLFQPPPVITISDNISTSITLDCGNGVQLYPTIPSFFPMSIPPTKFNNGFTITDTDGIEQSIKTTSSEIKRSSRISISAVSVHDNSQNIIFEDDIMKKICVGNFDYNKDGEISHSEAAIVFSLDQMKLTNKNFNKFNEFQYFISVESIPADFFKETNIKEITFPKSLNKIDRGAFYGCYNLTSINIPNNITSIGDETFYNCSNMTSITIPESITSIKDRTFYGCHSLSCINIPESVTSIGQYAFSNCIKLDSLYIKAKSLHNYGFNAFLNCPAIIYVPIGSEDIYKAGWPDYASRIIGYDYSAEKPKM